MVHYVPFDDERWNEIIPGLFMGGHAYDPIQKFSSVPRAVVVTDEFDAVVSLFRGAAVCGPSAGVPHIVYEINDDKEHGLDSGDLFMVELVADLVADAVKAGKKVLVRCEAGYNRSGLVVAFALMKMGYRPDGAINLIREKRSRHALCNEHFVKYIQNHAMIVG